MKDPAVLFVKPKAIKPYDKGVLRKAGVVVVEVENPNEVKFMRAGYELSHGAILAAAAKAIQNNGISTPAADGFGRAMCAAIDAAFNKKTEK